MIKAELITIGDELIYGHTVDTNAAFIGQRLTEIGVDLAYHTTVADNPKRMLNAISTAINRADVVLTTGGLGPTHDDITKKVICKYYKRQLVFHEDVLAELEKKYAKIGIKMPLINQNQALLPQGASFLDNKIGSALGIVFDERGKLFVAMPGVPKEMKLMVTDELIPLLKKRIGDEVIYHRRLNTVGIIESEIFEKVKDLIEEKSSITIAFLPAAKGVTLRLTCSGNDIETAKQKIDKLEQSFNERIGEYIYGYDDQTLPEVIGEMLVASQNTLAIAESCTGGYLGKILTDIPGSSRYFLGGVISYANALKAEILSVPDTTLEQYGAVSEQTAIAMAEGVRKITGADYGISITGIAGPTGDTPDKPVGLTYIGLVNKDSSFAKKFYFGPVRERNRERAAHYALDILRRHIKGIK